MNLRDLIYKKQFIEIKINELKEMLKNNPMEEAAEKLVSLLDERQRISLNIHSANSQCYLTLGDSKIDLNSAVIIRNSIKNKLDIMTEIINSEDYTLDRMLLMEQRDKFMEDYALLDMSIINTDINTKIN
jgi:hypothetical protein